MTTFEDTLRYRLDTFLRIHESAPTPYMIRASLRQAIKVGMTLAEELDGADLEQKARNLRRRYPRPRGTGR